MLDLLDLKVHRDMTPPQEDQRDLVVHKAHRVRKEIRELQGYKDHKAFKEAKVQKEPLELLVRVALRVHKVIMAEPKAFKVRLEMQVIKDLRAQLEPEPRVRKDLKELQGQLAPQDMMVLKDHREPQDLKEQRAFKV